MKIKIQAILKYILIFFSIVITLTLALVVTAKIPKKYVEKNIIGSTEYLSKNTEINYIKRKHPYLYLHIYADEVILNIIYNIDTENALKSVMEDRYYYKNTRNLAKFIENEQLQPNQQYMRYWHGSMIFVRPLLTFCNIFGIYAINTLIMLMLIFILIRTLIKNKQKIMLIIFIIAFLMTGSIMASMCLEYTWVYMIMLVVSIIAILIEKQGNKNLNILFFISGILTCFFDFLTAETLTILVPLVFIFGIRYKENRNKTLKEELKFMFTAMLIWGIGYISMWCAKWILASIILKVNALDYVMDKMLFRINGENTFITKEEMYNAVLKKNILALYPLNLIKNETILYSIPAVLIMTFLLLKKEKKHLKKIVPFVIISIIPYIRFLVLANHSHNHYFFTFRAQLPVIMSILLIFILGVDKEKIKKIIKKVNKNGTNRINNFNSSIK